MATAAQDRFYGEVKAMEDDDEVWAEHEAQRPKKREDCVGGQRPCPWVGCRHHLFFEYGDSRTHGWDGVPRHDVLEMTHTCVLDVIDDHAAQGGLTQTGVAQVLGVSQGLVVLIQRKACTRLKKDLLDEHPDMDTEAWLRLAAETNRA